MAYINRPKVSFSDSHSTDAFARARVSEPYTIFDSKMIHDNLPLFWDEQQISGAGTTGVYQFYRSSSILSVSANTAGTRIRQTKRRFNYQPGKALRHGEPVLTPKGWANIEDLKIGDSVFDGNGRITQITGVYPQGIRKVFRILFDDGTHVLDHASIEYCNNTTNVTSISGGTVVASGYSQQSGDSTLQTNFTNALTIGSSISGQSDVMVLSVQKISNQAEVFYAPMTVRQVA